MTVRRSPRALVLTVHGTIDVSARRWLGEVLGHLVRQQGNVAVLIDVSDARVADWAGLRSLLPDAESARRALPAAADLDGSEPVTPAGDSARRRSSLDHPAGSAIRPPLQKGS